MLSFVFIDDQVYAVILLTMFLKVPCSSSDECNTSDALILKSRRLLSPSNSYTKSTDGRISSGLVSVISAFAAVTSCFMASSLGTRFETGVLRRLVALGE